MGAMGVEDDPDLHYASSKAKAEALVRDSGLDWTILKPSLQFGEGDGFFNIIAGLVRHLARASSRSRATVARGSSRSTRRRRDGHRPRPGRPDDRRRDLRARRARATGRTREITREVLTALGKRRAHRADAGRAHPPRGRDRASSSTSRSRSRPTSSASSGSTTSGRSTSSRPGSASSRARWRARSATSGRSRATRSPARRDARDGAHAREGTPRPAPRRASSGSPSSSSSRSAPPGS